jgi:LPPG:FO 2-phospho-L-lactate transferase
MKGPPTKMMAELGLRVDPLTVAAHYGGLLDGYVMDDADSQMAAMLDLPVETTRTLMQSLEDREALAHAVLDLADRIAARTAPRMSGGRS